VALLARGLLGVGDALTFVSVLRFAADRFASRHYPLVVSFTAMLGIAGNLLATVPLVLVLDRAGWTPTFAGAALASLGTGLAVWFLLPEGPRRDRPPVAARRVVAQVRAAWRTPGTRAGFWVHFSCMSFAVAFGVLWGLPYLVAQGFSRSAAGSVLLAMVLVQGAVSLLVAELIRRHPAARVPAAIVVCVATMAGWAVLLAGFGGHPPTGLVLAVLAVTACGPPASSIGFTLARDYNAPPVVGTASGVVNVGGFVAGVAVAVLVGWALSAAGGTGAGAFRLAFALGLLIQLGGTVQTMRWYRRARAHSLRAVAAGQPVPVGVVRHRWDLAVD
jgi:cyanate permease